MFHTALPRIDTYVAPLSVNRTCPPLVLSWSCTTFPLTCSPVAIEVPVIPLV